MKIFADSKDSNICSEKCLYKLDKDENRICITDDNIINQCP